MEPLENRMGARIGGDISTEDAIEASQSSVGVSVTADGWVPGAEDGYTASATPAASAVGSPPPTLVVFFVASATCRPILRSFSARTRLPRTRRVP